MPHLDRVAVNSGRYAAVEQAIGRVLCRVGDAQKNVVLWHLETCSAMGLETGQQFRELFGFVGQLHVELVGVQADRDDHF